MREDAEFLTHVVNPDNISVLFSDFHDLVLNRHVFGLVLERTIIAVGHTFGVEADDFATVCDKPHAVPLDSG